MGNAASTDGITKPLAITALARQLELQKEQVITLRDSFVTLATPDEMICRDDFHRALQKAKITREQDLEIFDLLFTMWDSEGVEKVQCKEFSMGIAPLACPDESPESILRFALLVSDEEKTGLVSSNELEDMLLSIDSTASYFGDPHLKYKCIRRVVDWVFEELEHEGEMMHQECVRKMLENAYIKRFVSGKTRTRVKFKEVLVEECQDTTPVKNFYEPVTIVESLMDSFTLSISSSSLSSPRTSSSLSTSRTSSSLSSPRNLSCSSPRNAPLSSPRNLSCSSPRNAPRSVRGGREFMSHSTILKDPPNRRRPTVRIE